MSEEQLEDLLLRWEELAEKGHDAGAEELCQDCPELTAELQRRINALRSLAWLAESRQPPLAASRFTLLAPDSEPIPGYRLLERLGRGSFAEVWKADGPRGLVALKFVLQTEPAAKYEWRSLDILKRLDHPNLLRTYDTWQIDEFLVIAMELADGTLFDRWRQAQSQGLAGIPKDELLRYFQDAAAGIDYLQKRYIQHRDIKPQNLLLVDATLKVGDFGLTRLLAHSVTGHTGSLTLAYAAPEFFDGKTTRVSDQYSLAVAYCQMRGGQLPFSGTAAAMVAGHLHRPPDLTMVHAAERPVVARALAKRPQDRWPTCRAFVDALLNPPANPARNGQHWRRWVWTAVGSGFLALVLLWFFLWQSSPGVTVRAFEAIDKGHYIRSVAVGPVGPPVNRVVALSNGICPILWDVATGEPIRKLPATGGACAVLAPLNLPLGLTAHDDGDAILWDLETGQEIRRFRGHQASVNSVSFSPDSAQILSGGCDNTVRLWDRDTGKQLLCLKGHKNFVVSVAFDYTGSKALSGSWDGTVKLWDLNEGKELHQFTGHTSRVNSVGLAPDGRLAVSGGSDRTIRLWDVATGQEVKRMEGGSDTINWVSFLGNNRILAADGARLRLLDVSSGRDVVEVPTQPSVIQGAGTCAVPDRQYVVLGTTTNGVRLCELPSVLLRSD